MIDGETLESNGEMLSVSSMEPLKYENLGRNRAVSF